MLREHYKDNQNSSQSDEYILRDLRHCFEKQGFKKNAFKILQHNLYII